MPTVFRESPDAGDPAAVTADGDTAAALMAAAARDEKRAPMLTDRIACERAAEAIAAAAAAAIARGPEARGASADGDGDGGGGGSAGAGTFTSLDRVDQMRRVREWAAVAAHTRASQGVPQCAWKPLDAHAQLAKVGERGKLCLLTHSALVHKLTPYITRPACQGGGTW
jgi:hypothetical protein